MKPKDWHLSKYLAHDEPTLVLDSVVQCASLTSSCSKHVTHAGTEHSPMLHHRLVRDVCTLMH